MKIEDHSDQENALRAQEAYAANQAQVQAAEVQPDARIQARHRQQRSSIDDDGPGGSSSSDESGSEESNDDSESDHGEESGQGPASPVPDATR